MKIIISGKPGVGKTTLIKKLASQIKLSICGFYTEEILKNGTRVGFKAVSLDGSREVVLAHIDIESPFRVGKYKVNINEFEPFVTDILNHAIKGKQEVVIIDEIGKMELYSHKFKELAIEVLNSSKIVIATIKSNVKLVETWLKNIKKDSNTYHFELTRDNFQEVFNKASCLINESTV